jgi:Domain of unknown function (DUF3536)/Glycosyl hydrolase family 57
VTRGRLAIHAHFYQPSRIDPWTGRVPEEPGAAPFHDWNARVAAECYRPNAVRGNLERISWNLGPTIATWLAEYDPDTHARFVAAAGNGIAQAFNHTILPLASAADRRTEVRWGIRDFELRFGRRPQGMWLPETGVDLATLRVLAGEGIHFTILAPWQSLDPSIDTRHPYRVDLGAGASIIVVFYDAALSTAVSFEPEATSDASRFSRDRVRARLGGSAPAGFDGTLALIATDGELYGHHQQFRDLFLEHLVAPGDPGERDYDTHALTDLVDGGGHRYPPVRIAERTSWSCHHGVARWSAECPDAHDARWKGPLRAALERLAGGIDEATDAAFRRTAGAPDPWELRDAYVDVVVGRVAPAAFAADRLGGVAAADDRDRLMALLEAQRWRLAMFASDGWYWDDPIRPETKQLLRSAARAVRIVDGLVGTRLEGRLVADLAIFTSPSRHLDGAAIYRMALAEIGQPAPAAHP